MKTVPIRTCANCRKQYEKNDLVRYTLVEGIPVKADRKGSGRGVYLCSNCEALYNAKEQKAKIQKKMMYQLLKTKKANGKKNSKKSKTASREKTE